MHRETLNLLFELGVRHPLCHIITAILVHFALQSLKAQVPVCEIYSVGKDLGTGTLFHCFQDSKYRLWIASDNGVSVWDGSGFKRIDEDKGMTEMTVLRIEEDSRGNLWFLTMNGVPARYDGVKAQMDWGPLTDRMRSSNYISAFAKSTDGSIVYGTQDGKAFCVLPNGKALMLFSQDKGAVQLIDINEPQKEIIFHFSSTSSIGKLKDGRMTYFDFQQKLQDWTYGKLRTVKLRNGAFLYAVENRLSILIQSGDTLRIVQNQQLEEDNIQFVNQDWTGDIWVGTTEGALRFKEGDTTFQSPDYFLPGQSVSSICRDHESGLWLTTKHRLYHFRSEFYVTSSPCASKQYDPATAIHQINTEALCLGFESGKIQRIAIEKGIPSSEHLIPTENLNSRIQSFSDAPNGNLLVASNSGLYLLQETNISQLSNARIADLANTREKFCACLFSGWQEIPFDQGDNWITSTQGALKIAQSKNDERCLHVTYDQNGTLWIATFSSLIYIRNGVKRIVPLPFRSNGSLTNTMLTSTSTNKLLYGTTGEGLYILTANKAHVLNKRQGLVDNHVIGAYIGKDDQGWVLTSQGISKVDFSRPEPVVLNSFSNKSLLGTSSVQDMIEIYDTLWFAAGEGFTKLPAKLLENSQTPPLVTLSAVWINDSLVPTKSSYKLEPSQNSLRVYFEAASFADPKLIEYRYKLNGGPQNYIITKSSVLEMPNLPSGEYLLEIQARLQFGSWSPITQLIKVEILPPFWRRTWSLVVESCLSAILIVLLWAALSRIRKRKNQRKEALINAKHDALISQMNPHFVFNSLNSIQQFVVEKEPEAANNYLADFAKLMRAILQNARTIYISIFEETMFLNLYLHLEAQRLPKSFFFSINVDPKVASSNYMIPAMMLQPIVENSIWHGIPHLTDRRGEITVSFIFEGDYLKCTVIDNGIGRKAAEKVALESPKNRTSLASSILQDRIALMNKHNPHQIQLEIIDLYDYNGSGIGTKVDLYFPINIRYVNYDDPNISY